MRSVEKRPKAFAALLSVAVLVLLAFAMSAQADDLQPPTLPSPLCNSLQVPEGNILKFHAYAIGVQIYHWTGSSWVFDAPRASLYADPGYHGQVGIHYVGPTWESKSGSIVKGAVQARCTPDATAIPWLKLQATFTDGPGVFDGVSFIQRVNTTGGTAPATAGTIVNQVAEVPYTAEYYFYSPTD